MVHMAKPWRHPETQVYYISRQVPEAIGSEIGRSFWKVSLHTRNPAGAARLFAAADADLEKRFVNAPSAVADKSASNELPPDGATAAVDTFLAPGVSPADARWASLPLTWWLEGAIS